MHEKAVLNFKYAVKIRYLFCMDRCPGRNGLAAIFVQYLRLVAFEVHNIHDTQPYFAWYSGYTKFIPGISIHHDP